MVSLSIDRRQSILVDNWVGLLIWSSARFMPIVYLVLTRDISSHTLPPISRQMCTTHFCWGNLTIGWHPDDHVPFPRLRDSGESEKSFKNKKTRGGWGETARRPATAPFAKSRASYFRFARLIRPHYTI